MQNCHDVTRLAPSIQTFSNGMEKSALIGVTVTADEDLTLLVKIRHIRAASRRRGPSAARHTLSSFATPVARTQDTAYPSPTPATRLRYRCPSWSMTTVIFSAARSTPRQHRFQPLPLPRAAPKARRQRQRPRPRPRLRRQAHQAHQRRQIPSISVPSLVASSLRCASSAPLPSSFCSCGGVEIVAGKPGDLLQQRACRV